MNQRPINSQTPPEINIPRQMIEQLQQKTHLGKATIIELLTNGWRYVEEVNEVSRWEHPIRILTDRHKV